MSLEEISQKITPVIRGWLAYYGRFYRSALYPTLHHLNRILVRWAMGKYRRLRGHLVKAIHWLGAIAARQPQLFPHWQILRPSAG